MQQMDFSIELANGTQINLTFYITIHQYHLYIENEYIYVIINSNSCDQVINLPIIKKGEFKDLYTNDILCSEGLEHEEKFYNQDVIAYEGMIRLNINSRAIKVIKQIYGGMGYEKG